MKKLAPFSFFLSVLFFSFLPLGFAVGNDGLIGSIEIQPGSPGYQVVVVVGIRIDNPGQQNLDLSLTQMRGDDVIVTIDLPPIPVTPVWLCNGCPSLCVNPCEVVFRTPEGDWPIYGQCKGEGPCPPPGGGYYCNCFLGVSRTFSNLSLLTNDTLTATVTWSNDVDPSNDSKTILVPSLP